MRKTKNVLLECIGIWLCRAMIMLLLVAIPTYINSLVNIHDNILNIEGSLQNDYAAISGALSLILSMIVVWMFFKGHKLKKLFELLKGNKPGRKVFLVGAAFSLLIWVCSFGLSIFLSGIHMKFDAFEWKTLLHLFYLLFFVSLSILSEELFFRAYIINRLEMRKKPILSISISCFINVLFLLVNMIKFNVSLISWVNTVLIILLCGLLYITYHSLIITIGFRIIWSFLSVVLLNVQFFNLDRKESVVNIINNDSIRYTLKNFGITNNIGVTLLLVITILIFCILQRNIVFQEKDNLA